MSFSFGDFYSEEYKEHLLHKERISKLVADARELVQGYTLYGVPVSINSADEVIACLVLLYKDMNLYHEAR